MKSFLKVQASFWPISSSSSPHLYPLALNILRDCQCRTSSVHVHGRLSAQITVHFLLYLPFCVCICPEAAFSSMQASRCFCLTSSLLRCVAPEFGGGDPCILTCSPGLLFPPGQYPMVLYQAGL